MPNSIRRFRAKRDEYLTAKKRSGICDNTIKSYRYELDRSFEALDKAGKQTATNLIGPDDIDFLMTEGYSGSAGNRRWRLSILETFLEWCGNRVVSKMMLGWPQDMRTNVDWLEPEEAKALKSSVEGMARVVVHLELDLLMRRIEVRRVMCHDFGGAYVNVLGKGRNGGKWRTVHYSRDTKEIIGEWLLERRKIVARARKKNPSVSDPGNLLIYERGGELHAYGDTAIDKIVCGTRVRMEELYGRAFTFSNHTLRRTGGRMMFRAGVPLATISNIMGHESVAQTIKYLGINLDDQADAFDLVSQYEKALSAPQRGILTPKPVTCSGPKEI